MRDSIIAIVVSIALVFGFIATRRADRAQLVAQLTAPPTASPIQSSTAQSGVHSEKPNRRKDSAVRTASRTKNQNGREDEAIATDSADLDEQDQAITSIYQKEHREEPTAESAKLKKTKGKVIHGVPVQPWISARRNAIPLSEEAPKEEKLLRVYLQCMELKKGGPEYVGKQECEKLFANTPQITRR